MPRQARYWPLNGQLTSILVTDWSPLQVLAYSLLMAELEISTVRELEDLVIEGISAGVVQGKLDQKSSHFEVDYVIGRDIRLVVNTKES